MTDLHPLPPQGPRILSISLSHRRLVVISPNFSVVDDIPFSPRDPWNVHLE